MGFDLGIELYTAAAGWDLSTFLERSTTTVRFWASLGTMLLGVILIVFAVWQIASGLMSQGKKQTNWAVAIIALLVGGLLAATTGFSFVEEIASGGTQTIKDLGTGKGK